MKLTPHQCLAPILAATTLLAAHSHASATDYTFINIADNTGELGNNFSNPAINASGRVAFGASIGGGDTGIFTGNGGPLTTIVLGGDDNWNVSSFIDIDNNGSVCVRVAFSVLEEGIYVGNGGPLTLIAYTDDNPYQSLSLPVLNNSGQVAFLGVDAGGTFGIHRATGPGNFTTIAEQTGDIVSISGRSVINDSGLVAFHASTSSGSFIATGTGGALTTVVDTSDGFPNLGSVISMNNLGDIAFLSDTA